MPSPAKHCRGLFSHLRSRSRLEPQRTAKCGGMLLNRHASRIFALAVTPLATPRARLGSIGLTALALAVKVTC